MSLDPLSFSLGCAMHAVCGQVNNRSVCTSPSSTLTSSTAETVFRQSLILDWKLEVPGEDKSSFVRTTKSEILIRSGMFRDCDSRVTEEEREPELEART